MSSRMTEKDWIRLKHIMATDFSSIMGYHIPIRDSGTAAAFTTAEPPIYINRNSAYTNSKTTNEQSAYCLGLFYREMAKLYFSDYDYIDSKIPKELRPVFLPIFNAIENSIVTSKADEFVGGSILKFIKAITSREYTISPELGTIHSDFFEFLTALIQYSDIGILKGDFEFPLAKSMFVSIMPDISKMFVEVDPTERINICLEIVNKTEDLWKPYVYDLVKYMDDEVELPGSLGSAMSGSLSSILGGLSSALSSGMGSGSGTSFEDEEESDKRSGLNRSYTFKKLSAEEEAEEKAKENEELEKVDPKKATKGKNSSDHWDVSYSEDDIDFSSDDYYPPEDFEDVVQDCVEALDELMKTELEMTRKDKTTLTPPEPVPDFPTIAAKYKGTNYSVKNEIVKMSDPLSAINEYYAICSRYKKEIDNMIKRLRTLFNEDTEETEYRESGKISVKRLMSSTVSSKLCTKKVEPSGRSSVAVFVLIDESGSMSGTRTDRARASAIALSEVFSKLNLPLYVMGFTADDGTDVHHRHYLQWSSKTIADRSSLTSIDAYYNNFDGYSIRVASEILAKRPEEHKVLFVISDGAPAASAYSHRGLSGEADTTDAIREARDKFQDVIGLAIGSNKDMLYKMYKDDFVSIEDVNEIFSGIVNKFTGMVKKW